MKKAFVIITIAMCTLLVTQAKANLKVYNYTGYQMNIKLSDGRAFGISSTSGLHFFPGGFPPILSAFTYPGATSGGTGVGIVEWLMVNSSFVSATSAYTWAGSLGITAYTVTYSYNYLSLEMTLFLTPA